jgi:hypothetical protein
MIRPAITISMIPPRGLRAPEVLGLRITAEQPIRYSVTYVVRRQLMH